MIAQGAAGSICAGVTRNGAAIGVPRDLGGGRGGVWGGGEGGCGFPSMSGAAGLVDGSGYSGACVCSVVPSPRRTALCMSMDDAIGNTHRQHARPTRPTWSAG